MMRKREGIFTDAKPSVQPARMKPKADASPIAYDFARWDEILRTIDEAGAEARAGNYDKLRYYYEALFTFWIEIYEYIEDHTPRINEEFETKFTRLRMLINLFEEDASVAYGYGQTAHMPVELDNLIREVQRELLRTKIKLGLSVWTSRPISSEERLAKGFI